MQGPPFQKEISLPYSKWSQHRADSGLIYLAHPVTGEVKWLWSRHHDPKTEHDYLVNTITGKRHWVTKENAHFCPVKPQTGGKPAAKPKMTSKANTNTNTNALPNAAKQTYVPETKRTSSGKNHFVNIPTAPARVATAPEKDSSIRANAKYREIAAPASLGLTADEVLMLVPETGRRYVFNKKTKTSRWLPDRPPDTITNDKRQKPLFGRSKASKQTSPSPPNDGDDAHRELKMKTQLSSVGNNFYEHVPSNGDGNDRLANCTVKRPDGDGAATSASNNYQAAQPLNGQSHASRTPQPPADSEDEGDEISRRLRSLNTILADVSKMTTSDKYDMANLRSLSKNTSSKEQAQVGSQRLLELEEYLTQQMLKVDAVESEGNQLIRAKRKETVKTILVLTEEIERLRQGLSP